MSSASAVLATLRATWHGGRRGHVPDASVRNVVKVSCLRNTTTARRADAEDKCARFWPNGTQRSCCRPMSGFSTNTARDPCASRPWTRSTASCGTIRSCRGVERTCVPSGRCLGRSPSDSGVAHESPPGDHLSPGNSRHGTPPMARSPCRRSRDASLAADPGPGLFLLRWCPRSKMFWLERNGPLETATSGPEDPS